MARVETLLSVADKPGKVAIENGVLTDEEIEKYEAGTLSSFDQLSNYSSVYTIVGWISVGTGVVLILFIPVLRKWMHGVH
jgi:dipeptide/tripeptide permease